MPALVVFFLVQAFSSLACSSLAPLAPFLIPELGLNRSDVGFFSSFLYLGMIISGVPAGWMADHWGVRKSLLIGGLLAGLFMGAVAGLSIYWVMLLLVLIGGAGNGTISPVTSKGIVNWFDVNLRGTAMAIKQTGYTIGGILAAAVLPPIAVAFNWRWSVAIAGLVMVIWTILSYIFYRDPSDPEKSRSPESKTSPGNWEMLRHKGILSVGIIGVFFAGIQFTGSTYLVLYLVEKFGFSKVAAGGLLSLTYGAGAAGRLFWGWASDVFFAGNRKNTLVMVGIIGALVTISLGLLSISQPLYFLIIVIALFGFTALGYNAVYLTLFAEITDKKTAGVAIGIGSAMACWGIFIGPPLFGLMVDKSGSYTMAWVSFGIALALASIVLSRMLPAPAGRTTASESKAL